MEAETQPAVLVGTGGVLHFVAVPEVRERRDWLADVDPGEVANPGEVLDNLAAFGLQNDRCVHVLQAAAAAAADVLARWGDTVGAGAENLHQVRLGESAARLPDPRADKITGGGVVDEHDKAAVARDPLTTKGQIGDLKVEVVAVSGAGELIGGGGACHRGSIAGEQTLRGSSRDGCPF